MINITLPERGTDDWGSGAYQAPRGMKNGKPKLHKGRDYSCYPESIVHSPITGTITKLGYPYANDSAYRYVEITDMNKARHRIFYVEPCIKLWSMVLKKQEIGVSQDISARYSKPDKVMKNHIHYEIFLESGELIDPKLFYEKR